MAMGGRCTVKQPHCVIIFEARGVEGWLEFAWITFDPDMDPVTIDWSLRHESSPVSA